ncbi:xanthine dehydrogenase family protein [Bradyrhizobium tropiciagri]|uniref:xanthine dehydrogenase family protein molybdopterin-binding subunit n=1 Tax=Bradyrhizobium tropiciagri TaxID=312253 RepID=UPI001BA87707|nr:xanthine dehydrogenase family protein molybdopterin-binding subunit [Bradyrhizobium tropiciagri]MBR0898907.1 xanthine dehydrogenase family protein [Bradyrhizobium tropiciagri]
MLGEAIHRKEDQRLLTGQGRFVEDVSLPGMAYVAFVRSPHAHAHVRNVHTERAFASAGVVAVIKHDTWKEYAISLPSIGGIQSTSNPYGDKTSGPPHPILGTHITHVGEPIAAVIADTPYAAADAAELVDIDYEVLPVVTWESAVDPDATQVHGGHDNIVARMQYAVGDVERAFEIAHRVIEKTFETQSLKSMAIECRGIVAHWDRTIPVLNIWSTTQVPYSIRDNLCAALALPADQVRIMARDVGGGFGLKGGLKPEDMIVGIAAFKLGMPLRWIETRLEHMISSNQCGRQRHDVRVAVGPDGRILALDLKLKKEVGAYNHYQTMLPSNTINHLTTHYKIPALRFEARSVATNTVPCSPYRGAGRVEAVFTMDRVLDAIAREFEEDPVVIRQRNIVPPTEMPYRNGLIYRDGNPITYKNLDFPLLLDAAIEQGEYWEWRRRQRELRKTGRAIGIGISSYVEAGGMGPSEKATIRIDTRGKATVFIGVNSQGQGHETTLAQICADTLSMPIADVTIVGGDTNAQDIGFGTGASRVAINAGNAIYLAGLALKKKMSSFAAQVLDCDEKDVEIKDGTVGVKRPRQQFMTFGELAVRSLRDRRMQDLDGAGLSSSKAFFPPTVTWSSGVNLVVIEIERDTGRVKILKYVFVHDTGKPLNPAIVEGQIRGGMAQGLGIGLGEQMLYDSEGQPLCGSLMDYYVPRAADVPDLALQHINFPTDDNPLGIKSVGESGPNSPPAALAAAVEDALDGKLEITRLPVSWSEVLKVLRAQSCSTSACSSEAAV